MQIPYALISGISALGGFFTIGITGSLSLAWMVSITVIVSIILIIKVKQKRAISAL
jgi:hypothetical protein